VPFEIETRSWLPGSAAPKAANASGAAMSKSADEIGIHCNPPIAECAYAHRIGALGLLAPLNYLLSQLVLLLQVQFYVKINLSFCF
jgi:hypothetical protein